MKDARMALRFGSIFDMPSLRPHPLPMQLKHFWFLTVAFRLLYVHYWIFRVYSWPLGGGGSLVIRERAAKCVYRHHVESRSVNLSGGSLQCWLTRVAQVNGGVIASQATPFAERKGLVTLQPLSCPDGRNLMWPIRSMLFIYCIRCHGVQLRHNIFSGYQQFII